MSRKSTQILIGTTWLGEDSTFSYYDSVTELDWNLIEENMCEGKYPQNEVTLISVLAYLAGYEDLESISLADIGLLDQFERIAVLEALKAHWVGIEIQENLE